MNQLLTAEQRSQALAWYSVCGFNVPTLAENFGITTEQMVSELQTARTERRSAGKSPQPIPVKPPAGQEARSHSEALLSCHKALQAIIWQADHMNPQAALNEIKHTATAELKKAGRIL